MDIHNWYWNNIDKIKNELPQSDDIRHLRNYRFLRQKFIELGKQEYSYNIIYNSIIDTDSIQEYYINDINMVYVTFANLYILYFKYEKDLIMFKLKWL